jgi:hypothetical protein
MRHFGKAVSVIGLLVGLAGCSGSNVNSNPSEISEPVIRGLSLDRTKVSLGYLGWIGFCVSDTDGIQSISYTFSKGNSETGEFHPIFSRSEDDVDQTSYFVPFPRNTEVSPNEIILNYENEQLGIFPDWRVKITSVDKLGNRHSHYEEFDLDDNVVERKTRRRF